MLLRYGPSMGAHQVATTASAYARPPSSATERNPSATTNEGPAERRQHAGRQHGQHGQLVEWWKWKGEGGELEQVQVAWERGMGKGGKQQPVR